MHIPPAALGPFSLHLNHPLQTRLKVLYALRPVAVPLAPYLVAGIDLSCGGFGLGVGRHLLLQKAQQLVAVAAAALCGLAHGFTIPNSKFRGTPDPISQSHICGIAVVFVQKQGKRQPCISPIGFL